MALVSVFGIQLWTEPEREDFEGFCKCTVRNADRRPSCRSHSSTVIRKDDFQANTTGLTFHTLIRPRLKTYKIHVLHGYARFSTLGVLGLGDVYGKLCSSAFWETIPLPIYGMFRPYPLYCAPPPPGFPPVEREVLLHTLSAVFMDYCPPHFINRPSRF